MKRIFTFTLAICYAMGLMTSVCGNAYAETPVEISCNVDGKTNVSNVGEGADGVISVEFSDKVDKSTLNNTTVTVRNEDLGENVSYQPYSVSDDKYEIDLKALSTMNNNQSAQNYDPAGTVSWTVTVSGVCDLAGDEISEKTFSFSTGTVLPVSHKNGYVIKNVALGKTVTELGKGKADAADSIDYVNDGIQIKGQWKVLRENITAGSPAFMIDLEKQYDLAGVAIAGVNGGWYDRYQIVGGSNRGDLTLMSQTTTYIPNSIDMLDGDQIKAKFFTSDSSRVRYVYVGSSTTCVGCRELYVWAYVPEIVEITTPQNGAENVTNIGEEAITDVEIEFCSDMVESTLIPENITITKGDGTPVTYSDYTVDGRSYKIPLSVFDKNTQYTINITNKVEKSDSSSHKGFSFTFTTGAISKGKKDISEMISAVYPENNAENVTNETEEFISVTFAEKMEASTLTNTSIKLQDSEGKEVKYSGATYENEVYKIPMDILESASAYKLVISSVATESGYESDGVYEVSFTTGTITGTMKLDDIVTSCTLDTNSDRVTNVGDLSYIEVVFSKKVDKSSLENAVVILDENENIVDGLSYKKGDKYCRIDKSSLKSDTNYKLVIYGDKLVIDGITVIGENIEKSFKTDYIFAQEIEAGSKIINAARGSKVYSTGADASAIVDGNLGNAYGIGSNTVIIDLGGYYEILSVKYSLSTHYNYANGSNWWHTNDIHFWFGNEFDTTLANYDNFYTTSSFEKPISMPVDKGVYARYIAITNPSAMAQLGEVDVFVKAKINYGELSGKISSGKCTLTGKISNYSGETANAVLICAQYDDKDNLVAIEARNINIAENDNTVNEVVTMAAKAVKLKAFISRTVNEFDSQTDVITVNK